MESCEDEALVDSFRRMENTCFWIYLSTSVHINNINSKSTSRRGFTKNVAKPEWFSWISWQKGKKCRGNGLKEKQLVQFFMYCIEQNYNSYKSREKFGGTSSTCSMIESFDPDQNSKNVGWFFLFWGSTNTSEGPAAKLNYKISSNL